VDKGSKTALSAIVKEKPLELGKLFISGWLRKGGMIKGRTYARGCIVSFPFYNKMVDSDFLDNKPKGVRNADPEAFRKLLKFIFPNLETPEEYYAGSDSRVAPFFEAFLKSSLRIANDLQTVMDNFQEHLVNASEFSFNGEWIKPLE
ncbi:hypothetical protein, partial [Pseudomonas sp. 43(2021)]|uniref:hypothetical protein n=1 Tax=Pseudomonas sp. 43(2021) TaxID=2813560 RepID=UPI001A9D1DEF